MAVVSSLYLAAGFGAVALAASSNWPRTRDAAALPLAGLLLLGQLASIATFAAVPRPWAYGPATIVDVITLFAALGASGMRAGPRGLPAWEAGYRPKWLMAFIFALVAGLGLQVWFWGEWLAHSYWTAPYRASVRGPYSVAIWRLYTTRMYVTNVLAAIELGCVSWPGAAHHARRIGDVVARVVWPRGRLPARSNLGS